MGFDRCSLHAAREAQRARRSRGPFGVSLGPETDTSILIDPSTLLRFFNLISLLGSTKPPQLWLMVSPRVPSHVTALRGPSSSWLGLLQEPLEKRVSVAAAT
jgi:hypothetical protein